MSRLSAVLLLGGLGTRLKPFTDKAPKPLLPVLNRPLIHHQIRQLRAAGVREVVLALGHKAAHFRRFLGGGGRWGARFRYSVEKGPLGTGGALRLASRFVRGPALVLNGDILSDMDLAAFAALHRRRGAEASLALTPVADPSAFGVVETDRAGRVLSFTEKPVPGEARADTINAGAYLFEPSVFRSIPAGRPVSVERETFPGLLAEGRRLFGWVHRGFWADVGTVPAYLKVHGDLMARLPAWHRALELEGRRRSPGVYAAKGVRIDPSAVLKGNILLGEGCRVEAGAVLEGFVCAGPGTLVGAGARVADSVLHARVRVGAGAQVRGAVAGEGARLPPGGLQGPGVSVPPAP